MGSNLRAVSRRRCGGPGPLGVFFGVFHDYALDRPDGPDRSPPGSSMQMTCARFALTEAAGEHQFPTFAQVLARSRGPRAPADRESQDQEPVPWARISAPLEQATADALGGATVVDVAVMSFNQQRLRAWLTLPAGSACAGLVTSAYRYVEMPLPQSTL